MNIEQERQQLRQLMREKRQNLSAEFQQQSAELLLAQVKPILFNRRALAEKINVAFYLANDGELSPHLVVEQANELGITPLLPVLHPFRKGYLNFQQVNSNTDMAANRYGILEPKPSSIDTVPLANIDIIFMPLVAFDATGNRLGMGGGYYDRTLNRLFQLNNPPRLIGLAHDIQQQEVLPVQPWDVPITSIITPKQIIDAST